ncbi:MAG: hypothetical protein ACC657_10045 [Thiohalomonadales bacterium]
MDNTLLRNNFIILLTLFLIACQSNPAIKVFDNKNLRSSQYAKLEAPTGTLILEIDGKELNYAPQYHILPGERKLHLMVSAFKNDKAYKVGEIDISFNATAGHSYQVKSLATTAQTHKDFNKKSNDFLWIEDVTLDIVVAGKKP